MIKHVLPVILVSVSLMVSDARASRRIDARVQDREYKVSNPAKVKVFSRWRLSRKRPP